MEHSILALYIPDFQAWRRMLATGNQLVAIEWRGRVAEATQGLRRRGVSTGESIDRLLRLFPEAQIFTDDLAYQITEQELFCYQLHQLSPSLSLCYQEQFYCIELDTLSQAQRVAERLGLQAGIGTNDRVACLAALAGYQSVVNVIDAQGEADFLEAFPTKQLGPLGVEEEVLERLELFGYRRLGQVRRLQRRHLAAQFGSEGVQLHALLHAEPRTRLPLWHPPPAIILSFQWDDRVREPAEWGPILEKLCQDAVQELTPQQTTLISIILSETPDGTIWRQSFSLKTPASEARLLWNWCRSRLSTAHYPPFGRMTLRLGGLRSPDYVQCRLFGDHERLHRARNDILRRFPRGLLDYVEIDLLAPLPEDRWTLQPVRRAE